MIVMALIRLPCLMGDECEFQTVELEYDQAKLQLDGHMQYAHGAVEEYTPVGPDLVRQLRQQLKSLDETVKAIEATESKELASRTVRAIGASPASPAAAATTGASTRTCSHCARSCGSSSSASRLSREEPCPARNKVCSNCKQIGHFGAVCTNKRRRNKVTVIRQVSNEDTGLGLGEVAGLLYCIAKVSREVDRVNKRKVPHMLHEQLEWVIKHPPAQPCIKLSVNIDTQSYHDNNVKPPSALSTGSLQ